VDWKDGKVALTNLEQKMGLQVGLSQDHEKVLKDPQLDEKTKQFLEEKLKKAKELVENIQKRYENLEKLAAFVANRQRQFVEKGVAFLEPLLQKDIAGYLGISPSTVSRIVSAKYIQTPHGLFALKRLCPRSHFGKTSVRLQQIIKETIAKNPGLSDQKVSKILQSQGIQIARRTVAKHRLEGGVESAFKRGYNSISSNSDSEGGK
jgi:RNA polymerase sigma-54 factor